MADFYISNSTKQNHNFTFTLEKASSDKTVAAPKVHSVNIPYGKQINISEALQRDLKDEEIRFIIAQHKGITHDYLVAENDAFGSKGNIELIYSIGKPVGAEKTATIIESNGNVLDENAANMRTKMTSVIAANMQEQGADPSQLTAETAEVVKPGITPTVNEKIEVKK